MDNSVLNYKVSPVEFNPFSGPELLLCAPPTEPQVEIWASCLVGGADASCAYNDSSSLLLTGKFNKDAMYLALQALVDRHEALRSVFSANGSEICIYKNPEIVIDYEDLSLQDSAQHKLFIKNHSRQAAITPYDLVNGPLFKTALFKLSEQEHYLTISAHHIICDGWSLGVIMQDLSKLYSAFAKNETPDLPPALTYSQYAAEQIALAETPEYLENEAYWLNHFKGNEHLLNIPTDKPRPQMRTYKSNRLDFKLDAALEKDIRLMGGKAGASFVNTLLAAYEIFLQQITGQDEIIVGMPAAGQSATGNYGLVGHCVNLLALKSKPRRDQSFLQYLKERKTAILDAYEHQLYTFGSLLKKLNIPRDASRVPLVPVIFNIDIGMDSDVEFYDLKHTYINNSREYETFELFLNIGGNKGDLTMEWSYNTQLFEAATIKRMMSEFEHLLQQLVKNPENLIGKIPVQKMPEILANLNTWNNTKTDYPKEKCLHNVISEIAKKYASKTAVKYKSEELTYKQLNQQANQLASVLIANGVKPGNRVAVAIERSAKMVVALLAIMKAGGVYVPIDPQFPLNRINTMLADSDAVLLLTAKQYKGRYTSPGKELMLEQIWPMLSQQPDHEPEVNITGDSPVYIIYTSGSTGQPKGVQIAHNSVVNLLYSMQKLPGIIPEDKLLAVTTISFDMAVTELFLPLVTGAQVVIAGDMEAKDGFALLDIIRKENISIMQATPYTWRILLECGWKKEKLKVICGGEVLPVKLAEDILSRGSSLWNAYGPTEITVYATIKQITPEDKVISIGKPVANTETYVLDRFLNPLAAGATGEIYISGDGLSTGYINQPGLTSEKFVDNPFSKEPGAKMYRTGDLGTFAPNGDLIYLSRADDQVKIRGFRIETGEIELYLSKTSNVKQVVVMARKDNNGANLLAAYIVLQNNLQGAEAAEQSNIWRNELKKWVPDYMVPDSFIILPNIPLTPNGKTDKKALGAIALNTAAFTDNYTPPVTDTEKLIAGIWKEYLDVEKFGIKDNFFELGGHSLVAVKVMAHIQKVTGKHLPLAILFENSTVEKLALILQTDVKNINWNSLVPVQPNGNKTPLYLIHGVSLNTPLTQILAANMDKDQPVYGMQAKGLNGVDKPLDRIEDIAAHYISAIRMQNPNGPYALAGYSFGGLIAFEMARQLKDLNKEVIMLAMLDTYAYRTPLYDSWLTNRYKRGKYFLRRVWYLFMLKMGLNKSVKNNKFAVKHIFSRKLWDLQFEEGEHPTRLLGYASEVEEMNNIARKYYKLQPVDMAIDLFNAEERSFYVDDFVYFGWKPYAGRGINIHKVPGDHSTLFKEPNGKIFAKMLQDRLNNNS